MGVIALAALSAAGPGCAGDFDTARVTPPRGSLGREMYTLVCDRVGAQALREDIAGASYHDVCHTDAAGNFGSVTVDTSRLPPLEAIAVDTQGRRVTLEQQEQNRAHRVARIEALARRRDDLIGAFDASFTNETVATKRLTSADPKTSCEAEGEADLRTELGDMLGRMTDLYNDDTVPLLTRALSRTMEGIESSDDARSALARFDARQGYRPREIAMGVARPILGYPRLVELSKTLLPLLSVDAAPLGTSQHTPGNAHAPFVALLAAVHEEFRSARVIAQSPPLVATADAVDPALVRLSRPRGNLEFARAILLDENSVYGAGNPARWVVRRDPRGFARIALDSGKLPAPFVDLTGPDGKPDGLADVDPLGRFITNGAPLPSPFALFDETPTPARGSDGRAPEFEYLDVSKTSLAPLSRDLVPLLDPDPKHGHETVMDLVSGLAAVAGARDADAASARTYSTSDHTDTTTLRYRGFRKDASPLLDLVHAVGQVLADNQADDTLSLIHQLAKDKPNVLARLVGIGLEIKRIADAHPEAQLPASSTLWDELLDVLVGMAQKPRLIEDLLRAFEPDATLDLRRSARAYLLNRDELTYDRANLNGPTFNLTTQSLDTLITPVDRTRPDTGTNRSAFQRFLGVLHDANGLSICTKEGAVAHLVWKGIPLDFPSLPAQAACVTIGAKLPKSPSPQCGLFRIKNIAEEIVNAIVGTMRLDITDDCLKTLMESPLTGIVGGSDAFLETVSGIRGFNTRPTIPGLARIMYFDVPTATSPGDTKNPLTLNFLKDLFGDLPTIVCPQTPFTDADGSVLNLRQCARHEDTIRVRDSNALFPLEQLGFLDALKPLALAFRQNDANLDFVALFDALHRHWGSAGQSKEECDPTTSKADARWCSQDGGVSYEPLLADVLATDLFPTLQATVKELQTLTIEHCTQRSSTGVCTKAESWDGVTALAEVVKTLVDPAKNVGVAKRNGETSVTRNDGTTNPQVTPIYLLIDALKGFDQRLHDHAIETNSKGRTPRWRRARSQVVDQLLSVEGTGEKSALANRPFATVLPTIVSTLRSQLAAHCPDPSKGCNWARTELGSKATELVTGPTFASLVDVLDAVQSSEPARTELERLLVFLFASDDANTKSTTLSAVADLLQVFEDDEAMTAIVHAIADSAAPETVSQDGQVSSRGLLAAAVEVLHRVLAEAHDESGARVCSREIDPNQTLAVALRRLVTPQPDGKPSPIEVVIDVIADVNRAHPEDTTKLDGADYGSISREISEFCTDPGRGLEQVYAVLKQATKGP